MNEIRKFRDDLDDFADKWDKALKDGIFDDAPKPPMINAQTGHVDFFGAADTQSSEMISESDAKYWNIISKMNGDPNAVNALMEDNKEEKLDEATEDVGLRKNVMNKMATAAAPIRQSSTGKDQDPANIGVTFTPEDLSKLDELKRELHDLQVELTTLETEGATDKKITAVEKKVNDLAKKIDEMSDKLNTAGKEISQQGD